MPLAPPPATRDISILIRFAVIRYLYTPCLSLLRYGAISPDAYIRYDADAYALPLSHYFTLMRHAYFAATYAAYACAAFLAAPLRASFRYYGHELPAAKFISFD